MCRVWLPWSWRRLTSLASTKIGGSLHITLGRTQLASGTTSPAISTFCWVRAAPGECAGQGDLGAIYTTALAELTFGSAQVGLGLLHLQLNRRSLTVIMVNVSSVQPVIMMNMSSVCYFPGPQLLVPDSRWCKKKCEPCSALLQSWAWLASVLGELDVNVSESMPNKEIYASVNGSIQTTGPAFCLLVLMLSMNKWFILVLEKTF